MLPDKRPTDVIWLYKILPSFFYEYNYKNLHFKDILINFVYYFLFFTGMILIIFEQ
jgi:hypothetical protein